MKSACIIFRAFAPREWDEHLPSVKLFELNYERNRFEGRIPYRHMFNQGRSTVLIGLDRKILQIFKPRASRHWYIPFSSYNWEKGKRYK